MTNWLVDGYVFLAQVQKTLSWAFGPNAVAVVDPCPFARAALDTIFYGEPCEIDCSVEELFTSGNTYHMLIAPERAAQAAEELHDTILHVLRCTIGSFDPEYHYEYELAGNGDLKITVSRKPLQEPSIDQQVIASITRGVENGDYYPEWMRRLAGV